MIDRALILAIAICVGILARMFLLEEDTGAEQDDSDDDI